MTGAFGRAFALSTLAAWVRAAAAGGDPTIDGLVDADTAAIEELFRKHDCRHVYVDMGTNIGVQIRKLYEPRLYRKASILPEFDRIFGPVPRCHVCAIGFEPNPHHKKRLKKVEHALRLAGAPMLIVDAAISDADAFIRIELPSNSRTSADEDWTATVAALDGARGRVPGKAFLELKGAATVRTVDAARVLLALYRLLKGRHAGGRIFAKIDVEGSEFRVLPHLLLRQALCLIDFATIEWHDWMFLTGWGVRSAKLLGLAPADAGSELVQLVANRTRHTIEEAISHPSCKLSLIELDDESFQHDGMELPRNGTSVCSS